MIGTTLGHYRILEKIGQGGMGEVFLAEDTSLHRKVALKFLPAEMQQDATARKRFLREARSAAALDHPYICSIHEIGEADGKGFIVMEYVEGQTLKERISQGPVPLKEGTEWALEIGEALAVAHEKGIIHRDLKPSNIMLPKAGHVKVMDFSLAKQVPSTGQSLSQEETLTGITKEGSTLGTLPYMSPEQIQGRLVDHRSDLFAFGIVLYEMLSGINPFKKNLAFDTAHAITRETPAPVSSVRLEVQQAVDSIIGRLLAKNPQERYQRAAEAVEDLRRAYEEAFRQQVVVVQSFFGKFGRALGRPVVLVPLLLAISVGIFFSVRAVQTYQKAKWAREVLPKEVDRLLGSSFETASQSTDNMVAAYGLLRKAREGLAANQALDLVWNRVSYNFKASTEPAGANVYIKPWNKPNAPWEFLGVTPFTARPALIYWRCKIEKSGYETVYALKPSGIDLSRTLDKEGSIPKGMVRVTGPPDTAPYKSWPKIPDYYLDQYEVTNRQFREFIRTRGYQKKDYWKHKFVKEGRKIPWEEAMPLMVDTTGRPGPSSWQDGDLPDGQEDYPVSGVSWYEAAAYAEYAGKSLPTILH